MKCRAGIGTLFASRAYVQYTTFSARECKNKAVMCKPTIWIALERVGTRGGRGVGREVQSLVWRRVYEIADVIVCIPPSFRISRQILAKGVCAYCVHNTCATRGHEEKGGERIQCCYWTRIKTRWQNYQALSCRLIAVEAISIFFFFCFRSTTRDFDTDICPSKCIFETVNH